ncbi:MAG: shikimate kinase [Deltaproteobacteria bacterium]|nr:MAG: shikimate kinase [Deltaproteobacteria bacterium]
MSNIILIGMPAAGKSTVGILLAKRLGMGFMDTDVTLQAETGKKLSEIISEKGMDAFLRIESAHVSGLSCTHHIIATGGSVVYSDAAMTHLKSDGFVIHLSITRSALHRRIGDIERRGVVITPGLTIDALYQQRAPLYKRYADITVDCSSGTADQVTETLIHMLPYSFPTNR